jgi:hypothetical protein
MKVCFCAVAEKSFLKISCGGKKNLKTKRCLFVQSGVGCCPKYFQNCLFKALKFQVCRVLIELQLTVSGLAKVAIFTTNVDAENQTLINHKCVCGALNRHFCQTRVTSWPSVLRHCQALSCMSFRCFCPTAFVSVVGGEKIKHRREGRKK